MKNTISILLFGILFSFTLNIHAQHEKSCLNITKVISVDGNISDWDLPLKYYDEDTKITYSIGNDSETLYFLFRISDTLMQHKVMRTGIVVEIDTIGKKKNSAIVFYPKPLRKGQEGRRTGPMDPVAQKKDFVEQSIQMRIFGFKTGNGDVANKAGNGVHAQIGWSGAGDMIYELSIPLKQIYPMQYIYKLQEEELTLNLIFPAMEKGEGGKGNRDAMMGKEGGRPGKGGGMGGGGGMGRGKGGNMMKDDAIFSKKQKVSLEFTLAS